MAARPHAAPPAARSPVLAIVAALMMIPVILFSVAGFQVSLTLLLAPVAGLALFRAPGLLRNLFIACVIGGLISIALASVLFEDAFQSRYVLSLLLMMTPPLYFFLGRELCAHYGGYGRLLEILAVVSAIFVLTLTIDTIATGSQVRWYIGDEGFTVLNVAFLGLPLYGSYGVLSLASLLVLQTFILAAAFFGSTVRWRQVVLLGGFFAATFLVGGSNARGPQLVLPGLFLLLGIAAFFARGAVSVKASILLVVGLISIGYSSSRMIEPNRLVATARELLFLPQPAPVGDARTSPPAPSRGLRVPAAANPGAARDAAPIDFESLSTGRESLLRDSLREVMASPIVGNGFASFGRVDRTVGARHARSLNRTAHLHYLTVLWKGGLVFFVPYMALLAAYWVRALKQTRVVSTPEAVVVCAGVVSLFTILSLTWDILLVPSAGALGFFLLGALSESSRAKVLEVAAMGEQRPA